MILYPKQQNPGCADPLCGFSVPLRLRPVNCDNRALQVTYNPMGIPEIQSDIVDIRRRDNLTKLADRDPLNWHAII